jgi:ubiquinone/menaquinone biosynthesis C-methylase UbiE
MPSIVSNFFKANSSASMKLQEKFSWQSDKPFWSDFESRVKLAVSSTGSGDVIVDVGGGRRCVWHSSVSPKAHLVAIDIDQEELDANTVVSDKRLGDVGKSLPMHDGEASLVISRALLEHVHDVPTAVREFSRVLRKDGRAIHFVPARNSLFGLAARLGPFTLLKRLVHKAIPGAVGQVEFPVFYDHCTAKDLEALFKAAGFSKVSVDVCYSQSGYFHPVLPVYLLVAFYQWIVSRFKARNLAAYLIVDATK